MRINQLVDAVYCRSMRSFDDRIAHVRREMARHGIEFEVVFVPDAIPDELTADVYAPDHMKSVHRSPVRKRIGYAAGRRRAGRCDWV